jgi:hypothetical protein
MSKMAIRIRRGDLLNSVEGGDVTYVTNINCSRRHNEGRPTC